MSAQGEKRLFEAWMDELNINGNVYKYAQPIVTVRAVLAPKGPAYEVDLDFPADRSGASGRGYTATVTSPEYLNFVRWFKTGLLRLPTDQVQVGSTIFSGKEGLGETVAEALFPAQIDLRRVSDNLVVKVIGHTTRNGRTSLVLDISGTVQFGADDRFVRLGLKGYWLVDTRTGLSPAHAGAIDILVSNADQRATVDGFWRFESSL
jgi:hypothetical protein